MLKNVMRVINSLIGQITALKKIYNGFIEFTS